MSSDPATSQGHRLRAGARSDGAHLSSGRSETVLERWDRNFTELLQELRVAQTGVQILFAFLLSLPFTSRFGQIDRFDRLLYLATVLCAATAAALLIAPVSFHRLVFRKGRKADLVRVASRLAKVGLAFLLAAMIGAVFLVTDVVVGRWPAAVVAAVLTGGYGFLWYLLPFLGRRRRDV